MFYVEPSYYAVAQGSRVILGGVNFDMLPDDAIAVFSYNNNTPLEGLNHSSGYRVPITEKTSESLLIEVPPTGSGHIYAYIGGIVSSDGQQVYWRNDAKPLP